MAHGHTDMDRTLRGEMFIAHAIGHVATPRVILEDYPWAERGCPVAEAHACLDDSDAAHRALMWAVWDNQPLVAAFLITECKARVDRLSLFPGETGKPTMCARDIYPQSERIQEIVDEAYADIRLDMIVQNS